MADINKFFEAAYAVALAGPGVGGKGHNRFRLGAVIINNKNHILAAKFNCMKTNPKLLPYFKWPHLHAEAHAIISLGLDNCYNKTLYVVRILRNNTIALAEPCHSCKSLIKDVGIKEIFYSTSNGYDHIRI